MKLARDTWLIFGRHVLITLRSPVWVAFGLAQPVTYLLLFAPVLKLALRGAGVTTTAEAYRIYVPGLLTVMAVIGGMYTGFGLLGEIRSGIIERARVTPVSRLALMLGRGLREVALLLAQAVLITLLAIPFGLRVRPQDAALAYLLLALLSLMAISLSYGLTLKVRSESALGPIIQTAGQPVMLLSGVLLPLTIAPLLMVRIAQWNPFYWATNGMRALYAGHTGDPSVWRSLIIVGALAVVTISWSTRLFARSVA